MSVEQVAPVQHARSRVSDVCTDLGISDQAVQTALSLIETVYDYELYNGRPQEATFSGVVFISCRTENEAVTPQDVATTFDVERRTVLQTSRYLLRRTDIIDVDGLPSDWESFLDVLSKDVSLSSNTVNRAQAIGRKAAEDNVLSGRTSRGYAASALYAATQTDGVSDTITQRELADVADVSESTIRITYKKQLQSYKD